ncbi:MAG: adenylyltransferase/cytidyltransferase family protein [Elainellaceae cyanobacterium]
MIPGVYTLANLQQVIEAQPEQWRPLVFTNGCFDLIHAGHVRYLRLAKTYGRSLVIGLNSDESVKRLKPPRPGHPSRPIIPEYQRAEVLASLKPVNAVVIFPEIRAIPLIEALHPDVYVKGGDYDIDTLPEAPAVQAYGGQIKFVKFEVSSSTTSIIQHILNVGSASKIPKA